jgi:hypothetical protein
MTMPCAIMATVFFISLHIISISRPHKLSLLFLPFTKKILDPLWYSPMRDEFDALQQNNTWTLVAKPPGVNIVSRKWGFHQKISS